MLVLTPMPEIEEAGSGPPEQAASRGTLASPAAAAKSRVRGPTVLQRQAAEPVPRTAAARPAGKNTTTTMAVSGGVAKKTGMVLARAKIAPGSGGVAATRDRQNALLSKGFGRKAEAVAREGAVGSLATSTMPKKRDTPDAAEHTSRMRTWMKTSLTRKVCRCLLTAKATKARGV